MIDEKMLTRVGTKINRGKIYDILFPCVYIFSPLDHAIPVPTFTKGVLGGKMARGEIKSSVSPLQYLFFLVTVFNGWENYDIYST